MTSRGFTLTEFIVIAVFIVIGMMIAVPSYHTYKEARDVAFVTGDLRNISVAMEQYYIHWLSYPPDEKTLGISDSRGVHQPLLTTPTKYLDSIPLDLFRDYAGLENIHYRVYTHDAEHGYGMPRTDSLSWSIGPDLTEQMNLELYEERAPKFEPGKRFITEVYDPTNGTGSTGDIIIEPNTPTTE